VTLGCREESWDLTSRSSAGKNRVEVSCVENSHISAQTSDQTHTEFWKTDGKKFQAYDHKEVVKVNWKQMHQICPPLCHI